MKNIRKIGIIILLLVLSFGSVKVSALSPDRVEELRNSGQTAAADNANPTKTTPTTNSSKTTVTTPTPTTPAAPAKPLFTPPLGNGTEGGTDLRTILFNVIDVVQTLLIMATTLYLIYAGFMFVTAKGDPGKLKKAKDGLLWGLVGAALILCAEVLAYGIGDTVKEVFKGQ